ncbi:hypothetical protein [Wukongibacter baidiensis]
MKKLILMVSMISLVVSLNITSVSYAEDDKKASTEEEAISESVDEIKKSQTMREEKSRKILDNMKGSIEESYNSFEEFKPIVPDGDFNVNNAMDAISFNFINFFEAFRDSMKRIFKYAVAAFIALGLSSYYIFRKDKPKQKWGLGLMIAGPLVFLIMIYGPAIFGFYTR